MDGKSPGPANDCVVEQRMYFCPRWLREGRQFFPYKQKPRSRRLSFLQVGLSNNMLRCLILVFTLLSALDALSLPDYVRACKRDATLDECAITNGNLAWPHIVKGDPEYLIPALEPLLVRRLNINSGTSRSVQLNLTLEDAHIHGLARMTLLRSKMDLEKRRVEWVFGIPRLAILGRHRITGKFLVLPVHGSGPANVTLLDLKAGVVFDYRLENRDGEDFLKMGKSSIEYTTSRMYARLENLFEGNDVLSENMNIVLDDNWEEFNRELGPSIAQALSAVFQTILSTILNLVPYRNIFV